MNKADNCAVLNVSDLISIFFFLKFVVIKVKLVKLKGTPILPKDLRCFTILPGEIELTGPDLGGHRRL